MITILQEEGNDIVGIQIIIKTYKKPKKKEEAHTLYRYSANIVITSNRYNQSCQYTVPNRESITTYRARSLLSSRYSFHKISSTVTYETATGRS